MESNRTTTALRAGVIRVVAIGEGPATLSGSYTLERELGGGMSRVFVAEETALDRKVVIKVLPPETTAQVSLERFKRAAPMKPVSPPGWARSTGRCPTPSRAVHSVRGEW